MNFNIYLDDQTGQQLVMAAEHTGETRNALIRKAISAWLARYNQPTWPEEVLSFNGLADMPPFESGRAGIIPPAVDPLYEVSP